MTLLRRLYYPALFGGLGGLFGWILFGVLGSGPISLMQRQILGGLFIGGFIGALIVSAAALQDRSLVRTCRATSIGFLIGMIGGLLGIAIGEQVHQWLIYSLIVSRDLRAGGVGGVTTQALCRGVGWMLLGVCVGLSEGIAARSMTKLFYCALGGAIGGFLGGMLYGAFLAASADRVASRPWGSAFGLVVLGACIGGFSALVQSVFEPASLRVMKGWQSGREYPLLKMSHILGRDEAADIPLFRDMQIQKHHALIQRDGPRFVLIAHEGAPQWTLVNDEPVRESQSLADGDTVQLGSVVLRFHQRPSRSGA